MTEFISATLALPSKQIVANQLSFLKEDTGEFPGFVLDLVAFEVPFAQIVSLANEAGFSMTPAKLYDLVKENLKVVKARRAEFAEARLKYLVENSSDVIPALKSLYDRANKTFDMLEDQKDYKEAIGYLGNLTRILDSLAKLQFQLEETEKTVNLNVFAHGDLNIKVLRTLEEKGAIQIKDEQELRNALGFGDKPADFIERFKEV